MRTINLNDVVRVKLTPLGSDRLEKALGPDLIKWKKPDAAGYTVMQLWEMCAYLGAGMGKGFPLVCETTILLDAK